jgi:hypothetical protein
MAMFAWISAPEKRAALRAALRPKCQAASNNGYSGQNYVGFKNPEADKLVDAIETELDRAEARRLVARGCRRSTRPRNCPPLPLYFRADAFVLPKWLARARRPPAINIPTTLGDRGLARGGPTLRRLDERPFDPLHSPTPRPGEILLVLAIMSFVIYTLIGLMPGDPIDLMIYRGPASDVGRRGAAEGALRPRPAADRALFAWAQGGAERRFRLFAALPAARAAGILAAAARQYRTADGR